MPLVIYGESGVGKTSLMAKVVMEMQEKSKDRNLVIMYRFCGTTPDSSTGILEYTELLSSPLSLSPLFFSSLFFSPLLSCYYM